MTCIVVTEEQAELIMKSPMGVEIRGPQGDCLGIVKPHGVSEEDIQIALQRRESNSPRYTTSEVLTHLQSLENK